MSMGPPKSKKKKAIVKRRAISSPRSSPTSSRLTQSTASPRRRQGNGNTSTIKNKSIKSNSPDRYRNRNRLTQSTTNVVKTTTKKTNTSSKYISTPIQNKLIMLQETPQQSSKTSSLSMLPVDPGNATPIIKSGNQNNKLFLLGNTPLLEKSQTETGPKRRSTIVDAKLVALPSRIFINNNQLPLTPPSHNAASTTQRMQSNKITSNIQVNLSNKLKHSRKSIVHRKKQVSAISKIQSIIRGKLIRKQTIAVRSIQSIVALQLQEALNQNRRLYGTTIRSTSELFKSIDRTNDGIIIKDEIYIALIQCLNLNITKQQIDQLFHLIKDHSESGIDESEFIHAFGGEQMFIQDGAFVTSSVPILTTLILTNPSPIPSEMEKEDTSIAVLTSSPSPLSSPLSSPPSPPPSPPFPPSILSSPPSTSSSSTPLSPPLPPPSSSSSFSSKYSPERSASSALWMPTYGSSVVIRSHPLHSTQRVTPSTSTTPTKEDIKMELSVSSSNTSLHSPTAFKSTIPMMLQAAIRWAESWTFGSSFDNKSSQRKNEKKIHHDVHALTNLPYTYKQWLIFVQRASKDYDQQQKEQKEQTNDSNTNSNPSNPSNPSIPSNNMNTDTKEKDTNQNTNNESKETTTTFPFALSKYIDWKNCRLLKAEFDGLLRAFETTSNVPSQRQQRRIFVVPSFLSSTILHVATKNPLPFLEFDEITQTSSNLLNSTSIIEIYVQRDCGLEDAVLARVFAEKECGVPSQPTELADLPLLLQDQNENSKIQKIQKIQLSTSELRTIIHKQPQRHCFKSICRCIARSHSVQVDEIDHVFTGAHRNPIACMSCTTSAFVRYRAANCATSYTFQCCKNTNRMQVRFGSIDKQMVELFRLYSKEDMRCMFIVLGLYNACDLHPVVVAFDVDVWWSVVFHFGSVAEGLRAVFVKEVANSIVLSFLL